MSNTFLYSMGESIYVNITNKCTNNCDFCIRNNPPENFEKFDLWLEIEPTVNELIEQLKSTDLGKYKEIVFCGYGEPLVRADDVFEVCKYIRSVSSISIRINTNGQANLYLGNDITPKMKGLVDVCSISLNASNSKDYDKHCKSLYGAGAFDGVLDFASRCRENIPEVILTVVDVLPLDEIEKCKKIAQNIGVKFRVRELL